MDFSWKSLLKQHVTQPELSPGSKASPGDELQHLRIQTSAVQ